MIFILFPSRSGASGGGNQSINRLKKEWSDNGLLAASLKDSEGVLINSHQLKISWQEAFTNRNKRFKFVYRVDGPLHEYRTGFHIVDIDRIIFLLARLLKATIIFQSQSSIEASIKRGLIKRKKIYTVIPNAASFSTSRTQECAPVSCPVVIFGSWSVSESKGFDWMAEVDSALDKLPINAMFIGNTPIEFQNIVELGVLDNDQMKAVFASADIFCATSTFEASSNLLVEAIVAGLTPLIRRGTSADELNLPSYLYVDSCQHLIEKLTNPHWLLNKTANDQLVSHLYSVKEMAVAYSVSFRRRGPRFATIILYIFKFIFYYSNKLNFIVDKARLKYDQYKL